MAVDEGTGDSGYVSGEAKEVYLDPDYRYLVTMVASVLLSILNKDERDRPNSPVGILFKEVTFDKGEIIRHIISLPLLLRDVVDEILEQQNGSGVTEYFLGKPHTVFVKEALIQFQVFWDHLEAELRQRLEKELGIEGSWFWTSRLNDFDRLVSEPKVLKT